MQSFPDWFEFPVARTHQFRVIGNAVPPLVAEAIGLTAKAYLEKTMKPQKSVRFGLEPLPSDQQEAVEWLLALVHAADNKTLRQLPAEEFKRGWYSFGFLYPGLHPDGALDHGKQKVSPLEMMPPDDFRRQKWVHKDNAPNPHERIESMMAGMRSGWVHTDLDPEYPHGAPAAGWAWSKTNVKPGDIFYIIDLRQLPRTGLAVKPGTKPEAFAVITRSRQSVHEALVVDAISKGLPVSAAAIDEYSIPLPRGYVRQGDICFLPQSFNAQKEATAEMLLKGIEPRLSFPYFERSGWPVILSPVAKEAWRRSKAGELKEDELYCSEAVIAGMCSRNSDSFAEVRQERERLLA